VPVDCGEVIAVDPRGIGSGFRAKLRARPCALTACDNPVTDDRLEEWGTGIVAQVVILNRGSGYYGGLDTPITLVPNPQNDGQCKDFSLVAVLESSEIIMSSTDVGMAAPLVGFHLQLGLEKLKVLNFANEGKISLMVMRGQKGTTPVDHKQGTIFYLEVGLLLGNGSRCVWRDNLNETFAPYPYARSSLQVTFGK